MMWPQYLYPACLQAAASVVPLGSRMKDSRHRKSDYGLMIALAAVLPLIGTLSSHAWISVSN